MCDLGQATIAWIGIDEIRGYKYHATFTRGDSRVDRKEDNQLCPNDVGFCYPVTKNLVTASLSNQVRE